MPRYRFDSFVLSPRRRLLLRDGREQPLIPRYFDLLVFLIEHRYEAVSRRDIFDRVWTDVIVSDSALSQAIRTIRRTLGDDPREPRFIRTVSRHGYRFVFAEIHEEDDDDAWRETVAIVAAEPAVVDSEPALDPYEPLLDRITRAPRTLQDEEDQREAAEMLHALDTGEALRRLDGRPGHAHARALLRDTRWDSATAGPVPIVGAAAPIATSAALVRLRARRAIRIAATRWAGGSIGGGVAGAAGGAFGGVLLTVAPGSEAPLAVAPVLAFIGGVCGAAGGAGVGGGVALAEAIARSERMLAVSCGAALGGALAGLAAQLLGQWSLAALVGMQAPIGGGLEGFVIGGAAGLGYAAATARVQGGLAAPRGRDRARVAAFMAVACGLGALVLTLIGRPLVGGTVHNIATISQGAQVLLTPLGELIGDPDFGTLSQIVLGTGEGTLFGVGLALGLTRRPRQ